MSLTDDQRRDFAEHGWLVLRGVVEPARVAALEAALDGLFPELYYAAGYTGRVVEIASASRGSSVLAEHAHDRRIAALAAEALDVARLRFFQDTVFIKPSVGGGRVEWHQDYAYFSFLDRPVGLTARLALTPCTVENGCMRVVSGSHRWGLAGGGLSFRADGVTSALGALTDEQRAIVETQQTPLELQPGDVSLHHCLLFHASFDNPSPRPRKTLAVRLVDGDVRLDAARLPSPELAAYFPTDDLGGLREDAFPLLYGAAGAAR